MALDRVEKIRREFAAEIGLQDLAPDEWIRRTNILPVHKVKEQRRLMLLYRISRKLCPGFDDLLQPATLAVTRTRSQAHLQDHPMPLQAKYQSRTEKLCYKNGFISWTINL